MPFESDPTALRNPGAPGNMTPGNKKEGNIGPDGLTDRQRYCVALFAKGATNREVAKAVDAHPSYISQYRRNPVVRAAVLNAQAEMMQLSADKINQIAEAGSNALRYLDSVVNDPGEETRDRVNAAKALLAHSTAFTEQQILARQIANLERKLFRIGEEDQDNSINAYLPELEAASIDVTPM